MPENIMHERVYTLKSVELKESNYSQRWLYTFMYYHNVYSPTLEILFDEAHPELIVGQQYSMDTEFILEIFDIHKPSIGTARDE